MFFGQRIEIALSVTTSATAIGYETRVFLQFPAPYSAGLSSFPISCYQQATPVPLKLYCWRSSDRTLSITGFRQTVAVGTPATIFIYGIQQPLHSIKELFYVSVDSNADPTTLSETRTFTAAVDPVGIQNLYPILNVVKSSYTHNYVRAVNSIILEIKSPIVVPVGSLIFVYVDYLEYEFDIADYKASCILKEVKTGPNFAKECVREGNRYQITLDLALQIGKIYTLMVENVPTPDFYACNVKRPEIFITTPTKTLLALSTDIF